MGELEQAGLIGVATVVAIKLVEWAVKRQDSRDTDAVNIRTYQQTEIRELQSRLDTLESSLDTERKARRTAEDGAQDKIIELTRQLRSLESQLAEEQRRSRAYEDENGRLKSRIQVLETQLRQYGMTNGPPDEVEDNR